MKKIAHNHIPPWEIYVSHILEIIILGTGIFQTFFGNWVVGLLTLISLGIIIYPKFFTRSLIKKIPIEIEIILFIIVIFQLVVGESIDLYSTIPHYDKFVHYMLPFFIGFVGFLLFYVMHETKRIKASTGVALILIIFITLGLGALWEILEYLNDMIIYPHYPWHHFQGNIVENSYYDTMNDLVVDLLGGIFGSILGLWFLEKSRFKDGKRVEELTREISEDLFKS